MAEELEQLWSKLKFTDVEDEGIELGSSCTKAAKAVGKNCIVIKILTMRSINLETLRKNLRMLWKPNRGLQISDIDEELFLVEFGDGKDKQKVLEMCPWSFEKQLIVMKEFEGELVPRDIEMKHSPFWVQIFNLPLKSRTKETGWTIGSKLGEVLDVEVSNSGVQWGRCLRVRVSIDITKKLIRGKKVNGVEVEGSLQYGAWLRGDLWMRYGGDTTHSGQGRGQAYRQRHTESVTAKHGEPRRVVGAELRKEAEQVPETEMGKEGVQVLSLSSVNHNVAGEEFQCPDIQRAVGSVLHELGKVNGKSEKVEEKKASLGDDCLRIPSTQSDAKMAMQWEKTGTDKTEPLFKFKLAPNKSSTQSRLEEEISRHEMGPMAMCFDENVGWVAEKMGPISKHWKRLAREIKSEGPKKNKSPTKLKREGPTPLLELDPNALELKRRRGKNKQQDVSEHETTMVGVFPKDPHKVYSWYGKKKRRRTTFIIGNQGVVLECCKNNCTVDHLQLQDMSM
nr:hypothetical protein CFP56_74381 [Quercus suber]